MATAEREMEFKKANDKRFTISETVVKKLPLNSEFKKPFK